MSYKRYWVALAIVIIGSFAVLGGVGRKMISEAPSIPDVYNTDGQLLFTGSRMGKGSGSQLADRKSVPSGATALMSHPIGARIGCTGNRRFC
jgi:nitric oxide reductase large subunit